MARPKPRRWLHRRGALELGARTCLMGIVNLTPDSFSDGGRFLAPEAAVEHALKLVRDDSDIIDFGAESTRPGSLGTSAAEQLDRLLPVLEIIRQATTTILSIDTRSSEVARACLESGADVINDVSGLTFDSQLAKVCAEFKAGLVVMHMRGTPATMQQDLEYDDLIGEIQATLFRAVERAGIAGVDPARVLVDPGLGFGKNSAQNFQLIGQLDKLSGLAAGILVGPSRKRFTGELSGLRPEQRQFSTAAAVAMCALNGADVIRVHDVAEMRQVTDMCDRYREVNERRA